MENFDNIEPEYRKSQKHKERYNHYKTGGKNRCRKNEKTKSNKL